MSASWSLEDMNLICSSFYVTYSLTKWKSTSMCLVRVWKNGFKDRYVAPVLSHQRTGGWFWETPSSLNKDCTHMISAVALATALYSASILLWDTVAYFRAPRAIKFGSKNIACPPWIATSPISIREGGQNSRGIQPKMKTKFCSVTKIV
jgi:hypothetical protein